jgi:hypothetical protein
VGIYSLVLLSISLIMPRQKLLSYPLPTAAAFEAAFHSPVIGRIVLFAGRCWQQMALSRPHFERYTLVSAVLKTQFSFWPFLFRPWGFLARESSALF